MLIFLSLPTPATLVQIYAMNDCHLISMSQMSSKHTSDTVYELELTTAL